MVTGADVLAALRVASLQEAEIAGIKLFVRGVTGAERKLIIERARGGSPLDSWELVQLCACNERGDPLFTREQVAELANVDADALEKLGEQILRASKLMPEQQEQAAKN